MQVVSNTGATTLTASLTSIATAVAVAQGQNLAVGGVILVDSELMQITAVNGLNLTVTRGFAGTSAATHSSAATVTIMAAAAIGPILSSTTALPVPSLAITYSQIRIDGTALTGSGTAVTTDAWGTAILYQTLSAGAHVVDVQTSSTIPWREPCLYVGPVGATALAAAGLSLQILGNVTGTSTANLVTTNIAWATSQQQACVGQIITFTSGTQAGESYTISGASQAGSYLKLGVFPNWPSPYPASGDAFVVSNVATANAIATLPTLGQILGGDQTPINVTNGVVATKLDSAATGDFNGNPAVLATMADINGTKIVPMTNDAGQAALPAIAGMEYFAPLLVLTVTGTVAAGTYYLTSTSDTGLLVHPTWLRSDGAYSIYWSGAGIWQVSPAGTNSPRWEMYGNARFPTGTYTPTAGGATGNPVVAWGSSPLTTRATDTSGNALATAAGVAAIPTSLPPPVNVSTTDTIEFDQPST